jgi:hypothetical protein
MKTYTITFAKTGELPVIINVEAAMLRTAINKSVRRIEQMKTNLDKKGYDYRHLCGLAIQSINSVAVNI